MFLNAKKKNTRNNVVNWSTYANLNVTQSNLIDGKWIIVRETLKIDKILCNRWGTLLCWCTSDGCTNSPFLEWFLIRSVDIFVGHIRSHDNIRVAYGNDWNQHRVKMDSNQWWSKVQLWSAMYALLMHYDTNHTQQSQKQHRLAPIAQYKKPVFFTCIFILFPHVLSLQLILFISLHELQVVLQSAIFSKLEISDCYEQNITL